MANITTSSGNTHQLSRYSQWGLIIANYLLLVWASLTIPGFLLNFLQQIQAGNINNTTAENGAKKAIFALAAMVFAAGPAFSLTRHRHILAYAQSDDPVDAEICRLATEFLDNVLFVEFPDMIIHRTNILQMNLYDAFRNNTEKRMTIVWSQDWMTEQINATGDPNETPNGIILIRNKIMQAYRGLYFPRLTVFDVWCARTVAEHPGRTLIVRAQKCLTPQEQLELSSLSGQMWAPPVDPTPWHNLRQTLAAERLAREQAAQLALQQAGGGQGVAQDGADAAAALAEV